MPFCDVRMATQVAYGASGGPEYSVVIVTADSGSEQRIGQWAQGRLRWTVTHGPRTSAQRNELVEFFRARGGMLDSFRFKDWTDYEVRASSPEDLLQLTATTFQVVKRYLSGGVESVRMITKPVAGTLRVWDGPTEVTTGWDVDTTTGVVTFDDAPGYLPAASFEFDVPARFNEPGVRGVQETATTWSWSIEVIEVAE